MQQQRRRPEAAPLLIQLMMNLFLVVFRLSLDGRAAGAGLVLVEGMGSQEQVVGGFAGAGHIFLNRE